MNTHETDQLLMSAEQSRDMLTLHVSRADFQEILAVVSVRAMEARQASHPRRALILEPELLRSYREEADRLDAIVRMLHEIE